MAKKYDTPSLMQFDGARALILEEYSRLKSGDAELIPLGVTPNDLDGPLDAGAVVYCEDDGAKRLQLVRVRQIAPAAVRGRVCRIMPAMYELSVATFNGSGAYEGHRLYYGAGSWRSGQMYKIGPTGSGGLERVLHQDDGTFAEKVEVACGLQFSQHFEWTVSFGETGAPSVVFVTDPEGALEAFRLRDVEPGKSRRDALLHWVRAHWRKKRKSDARKSVSVRRHIRGRESFTWNGLRCVITPSAHDLKRIWGNNASH